MKVFMYLDDIEDFKIGNSCVALGNFDGVHKAHAELIKTCVSIAERRGLVPIVFTFINHPVNAMAGKSIVKKIMTPDEKTRAIEELGPAYMVNTIFSDEIMNLSPEGFAKEVLADILKCRTAVCGYNYSFGKRGEGNPEILRSLGEKYGFRVELIADYKINGISVSSSFIRQLIAEGRLEEYPIYSGRHYSIEGVVLKGEHLGRRMGFPTVNLNLSEDWALPKSGVYITQTSVKGNLYDSITNIGNKPSVGRFDKNAETHIFDFNDDIYGETIRVKFIKMLREERKFPDIESLSAEIGRNCLQAREYFEKERAK